MAFSISQFNSQLNKHGVAKTNLFVVTISLPSKLNFIENYITTRDLTFLCRSVNLPSIDINVNSLHPETIGPLERRAVGIGDFEVIPMNFLMDSNFNTMKFFHRWMQAIVNYDVSGGRLTEIPGTNQIAYEVGYKKDYAATITIDVYSGNSPFGGSYKYVLGNAFPVNVGNVTVAWENIDELMILPVGFTFDSLKVDGTTQGTVTSNPLNRIINAVENIQTAATLLNITGDTRTASNLQNFVNQAITIGTIDNFFR